MQQQEDFSLIEKIAEKENLIVLISTDIYSKFMEDILYKLHNKNPYILLQGLVD